MHSTYVNFIQNTTFDCCGIARNRLQLAFKILKTQFRLFSRRYSLVKLFLICFKTQPMEDDAIL